MTNDDYSNEDLRAALRENLQQDLKVQLEQEEARIKHKPKKLVLWTSMAAAIIVLVAFGFGLVQNLIYHQINPTPTELYNSYYQPFQNELYPIDLGGANDSDTAKALQTYEKGDYPAALSVFQQLNLTPEDDELLFYQAQTLLAMEQYSIAIPLLSQITRNSGARYREQASWYLALSYLKTERPAIAKEILEQVSKNTTHPYRQEAMDLLNQL